MRRRLPALALVLLLAGLGCLHLARSQTLLLLGAGPGAKSGFTASCTESSNFIARTSGLSTNYKTGYDGLICGLVTDSIWSKYDAFYIFKAPDEATALLNLVSASFTATNTGVITFTADSGYSGGSLTKYVNTNLNASTAGGQFAQNSSHLSVWDGTAGNGDGGQQVGVVIGANVHIHARFTNGSAFWRVDSSSGGCSAAEANTTGHYIGNRSTSTNVQGYKTGTSQCTTTTDTSQALTSSNFTFPSPTVASTDLIQAGSFGSSLTSTDATNFSNRMTTYMGAVP